MGSKMFRRTICTTGNQKKIIRTRHLPRLVSESVTIFDRLLLTAAKRFQERTILAVYLITPHNAYAANGNT